MSESENFLQDLHFHRREMMSLQHEMQSLAFSLYEAGNERVAKRIEGWASQVGGSSEALDRSYGEQINREYKEMTDSIGRTLSVLLRTEAAP